MQFRLLLLPVLTATLWTAAAPQRSDRGSGGDASGYEIVTEGSTTIHRETIDGAPGQIYIYAGGAIPAGTNLVSFHFLFDQASLGNTSGYMTPILFEQASPGIYTVIGIGKGYKVLAQQDAQSIPFTIVEGVQVPKSALCTFGYINAIVDSRGVSKLTSTGTVDFNYSVDPGIGLGGAETSNTWDGTDVTAPVVALGTTFGAAGATFPFLPTRTYSAYVEGLLPR